MKIEFLENVTRIFKPGDLLHSTINIGHGLEEDKVVNILECKVIFPVDFTERIIANIKDISDKMRNAYRDLVKEERNGYILGKIKEKEEELAVLKGLLNIKE